MERLAQEAEATVQGNLETLEDQLHLVLVVEANQTIRGPILIKIISANLVDFNSKLL